MNKNLGDHMIDLNRRDFVTAVASLAAGLTASRATSAASEIEPLPAPDETKSTVLITGANRGLGFEFARQYVTKGWRIIATCRRPESADALNALAEEQPDIQVERLDVTDHSGIEGLAKKYSNMPIDVLLNNAGIGGGMENQIFGRFQYEVFSQVMAVNVLGPLKMAEAFVDHVKASEQKKLISVSSSQGSIAQVRIPMLYWYRSSKSALNMVMANLALQLKRRGVTVALVTPGATATDFIAPEFRARIPNIRQPEVAVADMIRNIEQLTVEMAGQFVNYDGSILPW